jgi:ankyrin repeat protein
MDVERNTPLMFASQNGHLKCVEYLLKEGANPYVKNAFSETAIGLAQGKPHKDRICVEECNGINQDCPRTVSPVSSRHPTSKL